jgi:hypothetical protein
MVRPITRRVLALVLFAAAAAPVRASEVYQISTISSLLAGGYDGDTTVGSGAGGVAVSRRRDSQRAQAAAALSPVGGCHESATVSKG